MKAIQIHTPGGPDVLNYVELPTPKPGPGEVLVKAHAIGISMPEMLVRQGVYAWMPPLPLIPGIEMSGTVVETGSGCTQLRVGQKVFVCAREFKERANCYAEYIAGPENRIYAVPDGVDLDEVAGLANYQVAWHLLNSALKGFQYESVLVLAAAIPDVALTRLWTGYLAYVRGLVVDRTGDVRFADLPTRQWPRVLFSQDWTAPALGALLRGDGRNAHLLGPQGAVPMPFDSRCGTLPELKGFYWRG